MTFFKKIISREQALKEVKITSIAFCVLTVLFFPGFIGSTIDTDYNIIGIYDMDIILLMILILLYITLKSQIGALLISLCAFYFLGVTLINFHATDWHTYYFIVLYSLMSWFSVRAIYATYLLDNQFKN